MGDDKRNKRVRNAVDAYLAGVTAEELALLDAATLEAKRQLDSMAGDLKRLNDRVDRALEEVSRLRAESPITRLETLVLEPRRRGSKRARRG